MVEEIKNLALEDVDKLKPGRDLDIYVAWHVYRIEDKINYCPIYSVDAACAVQLMNKYRIEVHPDFPNEGDWEGGSVKHNRWERGEYMNPTWAVGTSLPHVVCLIALKTVLIEEQHERNKANA